MKNGLGASGDGSIVSMSVPMEDEPVVSSDPEDVGSTYGTLGTTVPLFGTESSSHSLIPLNSSLVKSKSNSSSLSEARKAAAEAAFARKP